VSRLRVFYGRGAADGRVCIMRRTCNRRRHAPILAGYGRAC
jgi:hypothetical protein